MKSLIFKISLGILIIVLAYFVYESIMQPLRFNKKKEIRDTEVIQRLKDIRATQLVYKRVYNVYAADLDTLIDFLKNGEIAVVNIIADPEDTTFTRTISDTIGYINVGDSLFKYRSASLIDSLKYIPFSGGQFFTLDASKVKKGGLQVAVFEASAMFKTYLSGLDNQSVVNLIKSKEDMDHFPGLKVGSMLEPSTDGNWE
ncbi:MAG: hypothetical protein U9R60_04235 [Bacteroidota bacterium]|nr:hypothetical protein [Bacteroidota bacterium]